VNASIHPSIAEVADPSLPIPSWRWCWQVFTEMRERVELSIHSRMEALLAEVDEVGLAKEAAIQSQQLCLAQVSFLM
jgi:hypothetical protein